MLLAAFNAGIVEETNIAKKDPTEINKILSNLTSEGKLLKKYTAGLNKLKPNRDSSKDTIFCILRDKLIP
ncbi:MAG: hypothetical protein JJW01_03305, partial [Alphaproteobacteria bacterium]|nr:hypothetical protein [Rickettsiales bacterium]